MKSKEIIEILRDKFKIDDVICSDYDGELMTELLGVNKIVKQHGGEGEGDQFFIVIHFQQHDVYIQCYGSYGSEYGIEALGYVEVFPRLVTTTEYFTKVEETKDLPF